MAAATAGWASERSRRRDAADPAPRVEPQHRGSTYVALITAALVVSVSGPASVRAWVLHTAVGLPLIEPRVARLRRETDAGEVVLVGLVELQARIRDLLTIAQLGHREADVVSHLGKLTKIRLAATFDGAMLTGVTVSHEGRGDVSCCRSTCSTGSSTRA